MLVYQLRNIHLYIPCCCFLRQDRVDAVKGALKLQNFLSDLLKNLNVELSGATAVLHKGGYTEVQLHSGGSGSGRVSVDGTSLLQLTQQGSENNNNNRRNDEKGTSDTSGDGGMGDSDAKNPPVFVVELSLFFPHRNLTNRICPAVLEGPIIR